VHLFERDCSIQRRYQKVLEEAPAPHLTKAMRSKMGSSAVDAAKAVNYVGAGTVEFIFDRDSDKYYFMEMNTRLQVEHPVTEMITKQDLVEWQLKVASGYPLPVTQQQLDDMGPQGHAFEARVYAEDPKKGFIPQTGTIRHMRTPTGEGVRVDTGIRSGDAVTPYYDPMISKLIVWDVNRTEALRKLQRALESYEIVGLNNNIPFLLRCATHRAFGEADLDTGFIPRYHDELFASDAPAKDDFAGPIFGALVAMLHKVNLAAGNTESPFGTANAGFRVNNGWGRDAPQHEVTLKDEHGTVTTIGASVLGMDTFELTLPGGGKCVGQVRLLKNGKFTAILDGDAADFSAHYDQHSVHVWRGADRWSFELLPPAWAASADVAHGNGSLLAPMPGRVTKILVQKGQQVKQGDVILALEAMKMEHIVRAPEAGEVRAIHYAVGELVEGNAVLAIVEKK
jgi:3-methylcrotonyl-CoA carboxylase alpha subunit